MGEQTGIEPMTKYKILQVEKNCYWKQFSVEVVHVMKHLAPGMGQIHCEENVWCEGWLASERWYVQMRLCLCHLRFETLSLRHLSQNTAMFSQNSFQMYFLHWSGFVHILYFICFLKRNCIFCVSNNVGNIYMKYSSCLLAVV